MQSSSDSQSPVELLADEFLVRLKRGEKPTIGEYCAKHPELAEEIRDVFEALLIGEDLKPGPDEASRSYGDSVRVDGKRLERIADYRILREIGRGGMCLTKGKKWIEEADKKALYADTGSTWIAWYERVEVQHLRAEVEKLMSAN